MKYRAFLLKQNDLTVVYCSRSVKLKEENVWELMKTISKGILIKKAFYKMFLLNLELKKARYICYICIISLICECFYCAISVHTFIVLRRWVLFKI